MSNMLEMRNSRWCSAPVVRPIALPTAWLTIWLAIFGIFAPVTHANHGQASWAASHQSVVVVNPTWPGYSSPGFGAPVGTAPAGSGVYYADHEAETGYVLTAAHVVRRATHIEIVNAAGERATAVIHAVDDRRDIAVLVTNLTGPAIQLGNDNMPIGSDVCAIGNSFGLTIASAVVLCRHATGRILALTILRILFKLMRRLIPVGLVAL